MIKKLTAFAICLMGSQIATSAIAGLPNQGTTSANQLRLPGNIVQLAQQPICQINGGADTRGGTDLRNVPNGQNVGFLNNGTNVTIQGKTADGQWLSVVAPGNAQGWVWSAYLTGNNCNTNNIISGGGGDSSNITGTFPTGRMCTAVGSPNYPVVPIRDYPNATGKESGNFPKGTNLRVAVPPSGQQSDRKWVFVESIQNPNQRGWVWTSYLQCQ